MKSMQSRFKRQALNLKSIAKMAANFIPPNLALHPLQVAFSNDVHIIDRQSSIYKHHSTGYIDSGRPPDQ